VCLHPKRHGNTQVSWFPIPFGGGPPVAPRLDHLKSISSPTLLQDAPTLLEKASPIEVRIIRLEQHGESSLKGTFRSIAKSVRKHCFTNALLRMLGTAMCSNIQTPMGAVGEAAGGVTEVDGKGGWGESHILVVRMSLTTNSSGRYLSAAVSSCRIQPSHPVMVFQAARTNAATEAA
jgi:hypothetical protein